MIDRAKAFNLKNGEFLGDTTAFQSSYSGGMPACVNSLGNIARAYSDTGYVGIFAKGSDVDQSGAAVTIYIGQGIFTLVKGATETAGYPYNSSLTYTPGDAIGVVAGLWSNSNPAVVRSRVLAAGAVSGGVTTSLSILFF